MNQEDKHKHWALEPDGPAEEPSAATEASPRAAWRNRRRWPVFGVLSWLAIPGIYPAIWLVLLVGSVIGILGSDPIKSGVMAVVVGVPLALIFGLACGIIGYLRKEQWLPMAIIGIYANGLFLLYAIFAFLSLFVGKSKP